MRTPFKLAVVLIALLAAPMLRADLMQTDVPPSYLLTLTENSSTSLTYTYNGTGGNTAFTIMNTGTDTWTVTANNFPSTFFIDFTADFIEPLPEVNEVNEAYAGGNIAQHSSFTVESDEPIATYQGGPITTYPNGGITLTAIGSDGGIPIFLQFIDNATASETATGTPDTASTLSLLAISVAGLAALGRFRRFRLA